MRSKPPLLILGGSERRTPVTTVEQPERFTTLPREETLEIHLEFPGRIHVVLVQQSVAF